MRSSLLHLLVLTFPVLITSATRAANITWDVDSVTSGAQDGTGIWNTSLANWWDGSANVLFNTGDNITIGATTGPSALTLGTSLTAGNVTFTNNGASKITGVDLGGNTLTITGTLSSSGNFTAYNTIFSNGTIVLANPASTAAAPDITKVTTSAANNGTVIAATVDVGTGSRFITGTTDRDDVARYSGDLRFDGAITGSATLNFVGGTESSSHNMHFVLNAANSGFTGAVNLTRGDLSLTNNAALSGNNALTFNVATSGQRSSLFLYGHNVTIGSLNDTSVTGANRFIRNGSLSATNGGTNTTGGSIVGSLPLGLNADSTLTINQTVAGTFGGIIADGPNDNAAGAGGTYRTLAIVKNGAQSLSLTGANTYTGGTTWNAGNMSISTGTGFGTGAVNLTSTTGVTLTVASTSAISLANTIALPAPGTAQTYNLIKNSAAAATGTQLDLGGIISGGNANATLFLNTNTSGDNTTTFRFAGNNSFTGTVWLNRGAIVVTSVNSLGAVTNPVTLDGNNNGTLGDLRFETGMIFAHPIGTATSTNTNPINTNGNDVSLTGVYSGVGGLMKVGAGTLTLSNTNTYTGVTTVSGGTLSVGSIGNGGVAGNLGAAATTASKLVFDGGTLQFTGASASTNRNFTINSGKSAGFEIASSGTTLTVSGASAISTGGLTKSGPGVLTLTGAQGYTGATLLTGGTLVLGSGGSLSSSTAVNLSAIATTFDISAISGASQTIASLSGVAGTSVNLGGKELQVGDSTDAVFGGNLSGSGGKLTKLGSGTLTLSGTNTYNGATTINGGTLLLGAANALPSGAGASVILSGLASSKLSTGGFSSAAGALTLGGNSVIDLGAAASVLTFADIGTWTGLLSVWNWTGTLGTPGGTDRLVFSLNTNNRDLSSVQFYSDSGTTTVGTGATFSGTELVPVPEPAAVIAALGLLGVVGWQERKHFLHQRIVH